MHKYIHMLVIINYILLVIYEYITQLQYILLDKLQKIVKCMLELHIRTNNMCLLSIHILH